MTMERELTVIHLDEKLNRETLRSFQKRERKGTSVVACANVVVMRRFAIATIFSFHRFYTRQKRIQTPIATNSRGGGERR
jgi:predicted nucleic acid-binding protein